MTIHRPVGRCSSQIATAETDGVVVIVVDDSASTRAVVQRLLVSAGLAVELYSSGKAFLAEARMDRPGCLILDVSMPEMSGLEVQECLNQRHIKLPLIFLTGSTDILLVAEAIIAGAADFVQKPFNGKDLLARVHFAIAGHHSHDSRMRPGVASRNA
jgi:FixJ family two-component response regulator